MPRRVTQIRRIARSSDVVIVGGGVMGTACAWTLAEQGATVTVLERSVPGAEASSAAAGILGAGIEAQGPGPMADLMAASQQRHPTWARKLYQSTNIDVGYRPSGILRVSTSTRMQRSAAAKVRWQQRATPSISTLNGSQTRQLEPALGKVSGGILFAKDGRIDPAAFFRAIHVAAQRAGVTFQSGAYVRRIVVEGSRAVAVALDDGSRVAASVIIVAAGSWSALVEGARVGSTDVVPARGQIVELCAPAPVVTRVIFGPACYLVPRDDGRVLVGSTLEFVGYRREVTARAVRDLLDAALALVPALGAASLGRTWSNFRPYTPDELPLVGETDLAGLLLATGHYRTGILLAPITAECIAALAQGRKPRVTLAPFSAMRARRSPPTR